jgi:signal transduction histidine kinase
VSRDDARAVARTALGALGARGITVSAPGVSVVVGEREPGDDVVVPVPAWGGASRAVLRVHGASDGPDRDALVSAFARHLGVALALPDDPVAGGPSPADFVGWDDLERLDDMTDELTARVTPVARSLLGATAVGITVRDPEHGTLRALPGAFGAGDDRLAASVTGPATNLLSLGNRVHATGTPYVSNDAVDDPGVLQPYVEVFRIHRILSVPLVVRGSGVGVLHLVDKPADFTTGDVARARALAPRVAFTVELARSVAAAAAQQRLEALLARTAVGIATGGPADTGLLPAFDGLGALLDASVVALVPRDSAPLLRRTGDDVGTVLEHRLVSDARDPACTSTGAYPHRAGEPGWAALHAPVELDGERTATLSVLRRTGRPFTAAESDVVVRLGRLVALAWTTERYQHQLAEIARLRERERIAEELHDRVAQILYAAQLGLDAALEPGASGDETPTRMREVRDLLVHGDQAVRSVIRRLGPGPEPGLARRLRREVEACEDEFGVVVRTEIVDDDALLAVPRSVADAAVKVAREGTVNAAKHAGPCRIGLSAAVDDGVLAVTVQDDGFGLRTGPSDARGMGLTSLRGAVEDAGGELATTGAADGFGTRLAARFPV